MSFFDFLPFLKSTSSVESMQWMGSTPSAKCKRLSDFWFEEGQEREAFGDHDLREPFRPRHKGVTAILVLVL